jgi:hypothetical protein
MSQFYLSTVNTLGSGANESWPLLFDLTLTLVLPLCRQRPPPSQTHRHANLLANTTPPLSHKHPRPVSHHHTITITPPARATSHVSKYRPSQARRGV